MKEKNTVSAVIIGTTVLLMGLLFVAWVISRSVVIQAELYNVFSDLVYSIIIVSGFLLSRKKKRPKYPEGLIRLDPIVAVVVGFFVIGTGVYIVYEVLFVPHTVSSFNPVVLLFLILSVVVKYVLYQYVMKKSQSLDSKSLYATAIDQRNDIVTHFGAIIGYLFAVYNYQTVEISIAFAIAIYVLFSGLKIIRDNIPNLLGLSVSDEEQERLVDVARSHERVNGVHDIEIHFTGSKIDISMHLEVDGDMSITDGHQIEVDVADKLRETTKHRVNEINLHLDPKTLDEWKA